MRAGFVFVCLSMLVAPVGAYAQDLPPGPGADVVTKDCSGCHGVDQITAERHDAGGWTDVINAMIGNGATVPDAEQAQIVTYLSTNFGPPGAAPAAPAPGAPAAPAAAPATPDAAAPPAQ